MTPSTDSHQTRSHCGDEDAYNRGEHSHRHHRSSPAPRRHFDRYSRSGDGERYRSRDGDRYFAGPAHEQRAFPDSRRRGCETPRVQQDSGHRRNLSYRSSGFRVEEGRDVAYDDTANCKEPDPGAAAEQGSELGTTVDEEDEDAEEEEVDQDDSEDEEKQRSIEDRAYRKWLPELQDFVRQACGPDKPKVIGDRVERVCDICPTTQRFKGWAALLNHAEKFKKKRQHQHRGYHRALAESLRVHEQHVREGRAVHPEKTDDSIAWPPTVIIANAHVEYGGGKRRRLESEEISQRLHPCLEELHFDKILHVTSVNADDSTFLMVFPATEVGYFQAKYLADKLASCKQGREDRFSSGLLCAYFAEPADMTEVDADRQLLQWSEESKNEKVTLTTKKAKQEQEQDRARIRQEMVAVDRIAESQRKYESDKVCIAQLLEEKDREVEHLEQRGLGLEAKFAEELKQLDHKFYSHLESFKASSAERETTFRQRMLQNEEVLRREQIRRFQDMEALRSEVEALQGEVRSLEEKKQMQRYDKEVEFWRKNQEFTETMQILEANFCAETREQEMELVNNHKLAEMQLLKECETEREELLKKWLEEQEALKKEAEAAREIKQEDAEQSEMSKECAVCLEDFGDEHPRAYFSECGHARLCMSCAVEIFNERNRSKRVCPICRKKLATKPKRYDQIRWG